MSTRANIADIPRCYYVEGSHHADNIVENYHKQGSSNRGHMPEIIQELGRRSATSTNSTLFPTTAMVGNLSMRCLYD